MAKCLQVGFTGYLVVVALATRLAPPSYSLAHNTVSDLGGQGFPRAWLMCVGFAVLGLCSFLLSLLLSQRAEGRLSRWSLRVTLGAYGLAVGLTSVFQAAPHTSAENLESQLHGLFAQIAGVAFIGAIVAIGLCDLGRDGFRPRLGWFSLATFVLCSLLSLLFFVQPELQGVWQRLLHLTSIGYLVMATTITGQKRTQ